MINENPVAVDQKSKNAIGSEIEEFQHHISSDKEICSVLSTNDPDFYQKSIVNINTIYLAGLLSVFISTIFP
jgi:hypothetical protein